MHDFSHWKKKKNDKKHMNKIEVEGEIERKGDSIYKVSNEISKEETKKILYLKLHF